MCVLTDDGRLAGSIFSEQAGRFHTAGGYLCDARCAENSLYLDIQFLHTFLPRRTLGSPSRQPVCGKKKQNMGV